MTNNKLNINGQFLPANKPVINASNRAFRYGDGFFETMKMVHGKIILANLHIERIFITIEKFKFFVPKHFTAAFLLKEIDNTVQKNKHATCARIRVTFFRGDGGLYDAIDNKPNYIIETWQLPNNNYELNNNGLVLDFYTEAVKNFDNFSACKTNNFLPYTMAAFWVKENKLNDAIILNSNGNIVDTTIANVFIVSNGVIKTSAITDGCINGVMRKHLLYCLHKNNYTVKEIALTPTDVLQANEVFITNVIKGLHWVKQCANSKYTNTLSKMLFKQFIQPLAH